MVAYFVFVMVVVDSVIANVQQLLTILGWFLWVLPHTVQQHAKVQVDDVQVHKDVSSLTAKQETGEPSLNMKIIAVKGINLLHVFHLNCV